MILKQVQDMIQGDKKGFLWNRQSWHSNTTYCGL